MIKKICSSCAVYIVLFAIAFLMIIGISSAYFYFHWYLKKDIIVLHLMPIHKQPFIRHVNGKYQKSKYKKSNILFFDDRIKIKGFNPDLLKIDKKPKK